MDYRERYAPYWEPDISEEKIEEIESDYLNNLDSELTPKALNEVLDFFENIMKIGKQI